MSLASAGAKKRNIGQLHAPDLHILRRKGDIRLSPIHLAPLLRSERPMYRSTGLN